MELQEKIQLELEHAREARAAGNEGRARVCARRAAGMAAGSFLERQRSQSSGHVTRSTGAFPALKELAAVPDLGHDLKAALQHLLMPVNQDFNLPPGIDLLRDAELLIGGINEH